MFSECEGVVSSCHAADGVLRAAPCVGSSRLVPVTAGSERVSESAIPVPVSTS